MKRETKESFNSFKSLSLASGGLYVGSMPAKSSPAANALEKLWEESRKEGASIFFSYGDYSELV